MSFLNKKTQKFRRKESLTSTVTGKGKHSLQFLLQQGECDPARASLLQDTGQTVPQAPQD